MHYANSNPKKFRTVIVNEFSPDDTLIASVDDECHVKFGDPKKPLALAQKAKPQWVSRIYVNTRVQTPFRIKNFSRGCPFFLHVFLIRNLSYFHYQCWVLSSQIESV